MKLANELLLAAIWNRGDNDTTSIEVRIREAGRHFIVSVHVVMQCYRMSYEYYENLLTQL